MRQKTQPIGLAGGREATSAPVVAKASEAARKGQSTEAGQAEAVRRGRLPRSERLQDERGRCEPDADSPGDRSQPACRQGPFLVISIFTSPIVS